VFSSNLEAANAVTSILVSKSCRDVSTLPIIALFSVIVGGIGIFLATDVEGARGIPFVVFVVLFFFFLVFFLLAFVLAIRVRLFVPPIVLMPFSEFLDSIEDERESLPEPDELY